MKRNSNEVKRVIVLLAVVLAGALASANAQDSGLQFGVRGGINMNKFSYEFTERVFGNFDMGFGVETGPTAKYSFTNRLSLYSELSFCYRKIIGYGFNNIYDDFEFEDGSYYEGSVRWNAEGSYYEMALLLPVMVQYTPVSSVPLYVSAGAQLCFPFYAKDKDSQRFTTLDGEILSDTTMAWEGYDDQRSLIDFGVAIGVGYMVFPKLGIDFRYVINLNNVWGWGRKKNEDYIYDRTTLIYFTFGMSYFL